jgi:hypothetical protein
VVQGYKKAYRNSSWLDKPSEGGIPKVASLNNFLPAQRDHVVTFLGIILLIDPHPEKQLFVQQAFFAFLKALDQLPRHYLRLRVCYSAIKRLGKKFF